MNQRSTRRIIGLSCVIAGLSMTIVSSSSSASCGGATPTWPIELPADQDRRVEKVPPGALVEAIQKIYAQRPVDFPSEIDLICLSVSGEGPIELGVFLRNAAKEWEGDSENDDPDDLTEILENGQWIQLGLGGLVSGHRYREILLEPNQARRQVSLWLHPLAETFFDGVQGAELAELPATFFIGGHLSEIYDWDDIELDNLEVVVVLNRIEEYCTMSATVSGDIGNYFFGDSAYFNTAAYPVKKGMMVGTIGETQTHETVSGFGTFEMADSPESALDLAARLGLITEEERDQAAEDLGQTEDDDEPEEEPEEESVDFAEWAQQELRAENPAEGDNFGLNLADIKADVTPKTDAGAAAMFAGAFTMAISGRVGQANDQQRLVVVPSLVMATVGLGDKDGDRISFELVEGNPLSIEAAKVTDDFIIGTIKGELETEGTYTLEGVTSRARKLKINVAANFAARRGSLSCMQ